MLVALLNECDKDGKTPLHLACLADKPDVVVAMLCHGNFYIREEMA